MLQRLGEAMIHPGSARPASFFTGVESLRGWRGARAMRGKGKGRSGAEFVR